MKQDSVESLVNLVNNVFFSLHRLLAIAILGALAYGMVTTSETYRQTVLDEAKSAAEADRASSEAADRARLYQGQTDMVGEGWGYSDDSYTGTDPTPAPEPHFDSEGGWAD